MSKYKSNKSNASVNYCKGRKKRKGSSSMISAGVGDLLESLSEYCDKRLNSSLSKLDSSSGGDRTRRKKTRYIILTGD